MSWHQFSKYGDENCDGWLLKRHQTHSTEDMMKVDTEIHDHFLVFSKRQGSADRFSKMLRSTNFVSAEVEYLSLDYSD